MLLVRWRCTYHDEVACYSPGYPSPTPQLLLSVQHVIQLSLQHALIQCSSQPCPGAPQAGVHLGQRLQPLAVCVRQELSDKLPQPIILSRLADETPGRVVTAPTQDNAQPNPPHTTPLTWTVCDGINKLVLLWLLTLLVWV